jgi:hypothetical protein
MNNSYKSLLIWGTGGLIYGLMEIMYRGYTHWTMILLAFIMSILLDAFNETIGWDWPFWKQVIVGGTIITFAEFIVGCIVNMIFGMNVWDYSNMPLNIFGQVCPQFWLVWCVLTAIAIPVFDWERYGIYRLCVRLGIECEPEDRPRYCILKVEDMEFSKKLLIVSWIAVIITTSIVIIGSFLNFNMDAVSMLSALAWAELTASHAFYYWKAKNENRIKLMQRMMKDWVKEYGVDSVATLAEIILKE